MSDSLDPSGSTEQFRVFAQIDEPEPARSRTPLLVGVVVAVAVAGVVGWLLLR